MGLHKIYHDYEAEHIADEIRKYGAPFLYKYRSWADPNHRRFLTNNETWFSHPFDLNDPHDIRRPIKLIECDYDEDQMIAKLWEFGKADARIKPEHLEMEVMTRAAAIKKDPYAYFGANIENMYNDRSFYNRIGVFSVSKQCLIPEMWNNYSAVDGFCVGFDSGKLVRDLQYFVGHAKYTDEPMEVCLAEGFTEEHSRTEIMLKYKKWEYEDEFRFIAFSIKTEKDRVKLFSSEAVVEIILSYNINDKAQQEIIEVATNKYPQASIYKLVQDKNNLIKKRIA